MTSTARIGDLLAKRRTLSFEFFPPATSKGVEQLNRTLADLSVLNPAFVSVTTGAGGSKTDTTRDVVIEMQQKSPFPVMAHLTCAQHNRKQIRALLNSYSSSGVFNILALAGDPPEEAEAVAALEREEASDETASSFESPPASRRDSLAPKEVSGEADSSTLRYASELVAEIRNHSVACLLYTSPSPRD